MRAWCLLYRVQRVEREGRGGGGERKKMKIWRMCWSNSSCSFQTWRHWSSGKIRYCNIPTNIPHWWWVQQMTPRLTHLWHAIEINGIFWHFRIIVWNIAHHYFRKVPQTCNAQVYSFAIIHSNVTESTNAFNIQMYLIHRSKMSKHLKETHPHTPLSFIIHMKNEYNALSACQLTN